MDYFCNGCGNVAIANDMEEIKSYRKLCSDCLSTSNRKSLVRVKPSKTSKKTRRGKKSKAFTFICNNCEHDSGRDSKPWSCKECNKNSFRRVVKN